MINTFVYPINLYHLVYYNPMKKVAVLMIQHRGEILQIVEDLNKITTNFCRSKQLTLKVNEWVEQPKISILDFKYVYKAKAKGTFLAI